MATCNVSPQVGGAAVVGAAGVKAGAGAVCALPATGAHFAGQAGSALQGLAIAGTAMLGSGLALLRAGRNVKRSAGDDLD